MPVTESDRSRSRWLWAGLSLGAILASTAYAYRSGLFEPPAASPPASASPAASEPVRKPPLFFWSATTDSNELKWRSKTDWAQKIDFAGAPIRRDIIILYSQFLGHYPRFGLHLAQKPGFLDEHVKKVQRDVQEQVPAGFTGLVCIDYESWNVLWDRLVNEPGSPDPNADDADLKDDWREHIKAVTGGWSSLSAEQQEDLCRVTYNRAAREFFVKTLAACQAARPDPRWGFFDYPSSQYRGVATGGEIGYAEDGQCLASKQNDELRWLFDAVDVLYPAPYVLAESIPSNQLPSWESATNSIEEGRQHVYRNVREAVRLANGKPVVAYMWPRYQRLNSRLTGKFLSDTNLRMCLEVPFDAGADGVAIWESFNKASDFEPLQEYMRDKIAPIITELTAKPK